MAKLSFMVKLSNTLATLLLIGVHGFACFKLFISYLLGFHGRDFILFLAGVLQVFLVFMSIYQWFPCAPKDAFRAVGYWYVLAVILNCSSTGLGMLFFDLLAFAALVCQLAALAFAYHRLSNYPPRHFIDLLFVNVPLSIYTAATAFLALWQAIQFRSETKDQPWAIILVISMAGFMALHLVDYSYRNDWAYAMTTGWILLGASVFFTDTTHVVSLVAVGVLLNGVVRALIPKWLLRTNRRSSECAIRDSERGPLLGNH